MYDGADMPSSDLPEEHTGPEPVALAPDVSKLQRIRGYEGNKYYGSGKS